MPDDRSIQELEETRKDSYPHGSSGNNSKGYPHHTRWDTNGRTSWDENPPGKPSEQHDKPTKNK